VPGSALVSPFLQDMSVRGVWTRRQIEYQDEAQGLITQDYIQNEVSTNHPVGINRSPQVSMMGCKSYLSRGDYQYGNGGYR
jgi:hypothetical protein